MVSRHVGASSASLHGADEELLQPLHTFPFNVRPAAAMGMAIVPQLFLTDLDQSLPHLLKAVSSPKAWTHGAPAQAAQLPHPCRWLRGT